ncbi:hypothetical protein Bhyg_02073, partial [Pseudolycoriella hygida]
EFENESGTLEPTRTEYPIFRAISSPERANPQNESVNPLPNAHIIAINENIIQINEEVDNNNGPLSPADMENIENNNAVDYIPNRNEIERLVEPVEQEQLQQPLFDRSNPFIEQIDVLSNRNNPFVNIIVNENFYSNVDSPVNLIDAVTSKNQIMSPKSLEEVISLDSSLSEKSATDINSVEEALRALDFAISGEESLLQPNEDDFECYNEDFAFTCHEIAKSFTDDEYKGNEAKQIFDSEYMDEVRKEAESLVNSVIAESTDRINQGLVSTQRIMSQNDDTLVDVDSNTFIAKEAIENATQISSDSLTDGQILPKDFQSVENLCFDNIMLEASTPFVKLKRERFPDSPSFTGSPIVANATFDIESECPSNNIFGKMDGIIGISPIVSEEGRLGSTFNVQKNELIKENCLDTSAYFESPPINTTFDIDMKQSNGTSPFLGDTKQLEKNLSVEQMPNPVNETFTACDATFSKEPEVEALTKTDCPTIKIDKEETTSVDMTTVTPVNTPIELNYSLDSWDKFISNSMSQQLDMPKHIPEMQPCTSAQAAYAEASTSGWFLHPKADDPPSSSDTCEVDDENEENLNETFDALRKQLIIMLPHAQGIAEHPPDFSDDDDDDDYTEEKPEQRSPCENVTELPTEMVINYKRPLSPIMEESEDETCKTFILNETKNFDSTSTGCIETGEAIMGVTKTLMASNDTLFNFEDAFGDDAFSPRTTSQNDIVKESKLNHPDSSDASTPTPRTFKPIEFETHETCNVNDLLSPDQQKTLSEDICTVDHVSSDAVDTTFTTNTLEEKTCISVHMKDDEKISEISEPDWGSSGQFDLNSLNDVPSMDILDNDDEHGTEFENDDSSSTVNLPNKEENVVEDHPNPSIFSTVHQNEDDESFKNKTTNFLLNEINYSSGYYNKSSDIKPIIYDNVKENTDPNVKEYDRIETFSKNDNKILIHTKNLAESGIFEGDLLSETDEIVQNSTFHPADITFDLNKHQAIIPNFTVCEIDTQGDQGVMVTREIVHQLSGEEDPWAHSISDIRFTGPCTEIMSTSFTNSEWDSDVDDSNSSEEFMYVKGTPPKVPSPELYKHKLEQKHESVTVPAVAEEDVENIWKTHEDKVPVTGIEHTDKEQYEDEDSSSDAEGEWVPSCWDSLAQPSRSALKSPDKSSSSPKKRRSVAFKKQNYHSVYEYPKEVAMSPSYSEPQLWARDLNDLFNFVEKKSEAIDVKVSESDGFNVSSSTRPFHGSQFNAQCHTWPTDSNFSWSQIQISVPGILDPFQAQIRQDNESHSDKYPSYSDLQIKWPKDLKDFICSEQTSENIEKDLTRPDSGVGESAELLSDSVTLGDLCHTKASLRLPLQNVPALMTDETKNLFNDESIDQNNLILPTPSCTGSMDSLSSSSGSERQVSFSTFGKSKSLSFDNDRINASDCKSLMIAEEEKLNENDGPKLENDRCTKQNDSTDEDSGIESIMRIASEKI